MSVTYKKYMKRCDKSKIDGRILDLEKETEEIKMELVSLASMTPQKQTDLQGHEIPMHSYIVTEINNLLEGLWSASIELNDLACIRENEINNPEDNEWCE